MKKCRKCGVENPESNFYRKSDNPDGLDRWCKTCRNENMKRYQGKTSLPYSTEEALRLLSMNGIHAAVGYVYGRPYRDIVAYGYLTIEAKSAIVKNEYGHYLFGLTKAQHEHTCDFYVLICKDVGRVFIVPRDALDLTKAKIYFSLRDPRWNEFENAFHLIRERVISDAAKDTDIKSVRVFSGGKYHTLAT